MRRPSFEGVVRFLRTESGSAAFLFAAAALALAWSNSPWNGLYSALWGSDAIALPSVGLPFDVRHWVNEAAMAIFFYVVGMEISRELRAGELTDPKRAALPIIAAVGGMAAPALLYISIVRGGDGLSGWAIPMATDIAFAIGALALLGSRVPEGLRILLLSLAIVDDIGAIVVIALVYSHGIGVAWLAGAVASVGAYAWAAPRARGRRSVVPLLVVAVAGWYCASRSGLHPTIAGVAFGLVTPATRGVFVDAEHRLHALSSFVVVPLFALANAGVDLGGGALQSAFRSKLFWAVTLGLILGKLIGIGSPLLLAYRRAAAAIPPGVVIRDLVGVAALGGIGFTVALFVSALAFDDPSALDAAKTGVLAGSLGSAVLGAALLWPRPAQAGSKSMRDRPRST